MILPFLALSTCSWLVVYGVIHRACGGHARAFAWFVIVHNVAVFALIVTALLLAPDPFDWMGPATDGLLQVTLLEIGFMGASIALMLPPVRANLGPADLGHHAFYSLLCLYSVHIGEFRTAVAWPCIWVITGSAHQATVLLKLSGGRDRPAYRRWVLAHVLLILAVRGLVGTAAMTAALVDFSARPSPSLLWNVLFVASAILGTTLNVLWLAQNTARWRRLR